MNRQRLASILSLSILAACFAGCNLEPKPDANLLKLRKATLLTNEPAGFETIVDAKKKDFSNDVQVTVEGCVDLTLLSEANQGKAIFIIREVLENDHGGSEHDPANCPFCKRRLAAAAKAAVAIVDDEGKVLPYGAVELLELEQGDMVVVTGNAKFDKTLDILQIRSSEVFVR